MSIDYLSKIKTNISANFTGSQKVDIKFMEDSFYLLHAKGGFEGLFNNTITRDNCESLRDIITEFNLASNIVKSHPALKIDYEPAMPVENSGPDFRVLYNETIYIIQVKRIRRSCSYKAYGLDETNEENYAVPFVRVDDIPQLQSALTKARKKFSIAKETVFLIVQEISSEADMDFITQSEAVFGREQYIYCSKKRFITRDKTKFFFTELGQSVAGYINLRPKNNDLFHDYKMALFLNKRYENIEESIKDLLEIESVYKYEDLPK